jgi:cardiolipin synthase
MSVNPFRRHLSRLDMRNHRKLAIIDGKIAFTGSQNIEMKDYDRSRPEAWHDLMVKIVGPAVLKLQLIFIEDWYFATGTHLESAGIFPPAEVAGNIPIQAVPSGPHDPVVSLRDLMIAAIYEARERIIITSPYFIPDEPSLLALSLAAHRGVRVDLLIPRHADHPVVGAVARSAFDKLFEAGINIHFHRGVLHSKTMSVDRTLSLIGTANFDPRSFHLHSELSLLLYGDEVTGRLREKQIEYITQSDLVDPERWAGRPWIKRRRDEVFKLLTPLL